MQTFVPWFFSIDSYVLTCQDPSLFRTSFSARHSYIFCTSIAGTNIFKDISKYNRSVFIAIRKGTWSYLSSKFDLPHGNWISLVDSLETSLKKEGKLCSTAPASSRSHHALAIKKSIHYAVTFQLSVLNSCNSKATLWTHKKHILLKVQQEITVQVISCLSTLQVEGQSLFLHLSVDWSSHIKWKNLQFSTYTHKSTKHVNRGMGYSIVVSFEGFHNLYS